MSSSAVPAKPGLGALAGLAAAVILAWGWPRRLIALAAGACGALAMAPIDVPLALLPTMMIAVWLIDGSVDQSASGRIGAASLRAAFGAGWWWGFGYFLAGLWWLGAAFLVDAQYAWALPLGVVGLPAALAIFPAFGFALARLVWSHGSARIFALAFGLAASEWLRGNLLSGFPWNEFGMALGGSLWLAQFGSIVGLHGLTLIAVLVAAAPATLWDDGGAFGRFVPSGVAVALCAALAGFGLWRLSAPAPDVVPGPKLRIMQPNVSQGADFAPARGAEVLARYLALSDRATSPERSGVADVTHLFWPESAFPFILAREAGALARISDFLRSGAVLTTGAARMEEDRRAPRGVRFYNSIAILDRTGLRAERYDKRHLVPFGEYLPLRPWLERLGISQFVQAPGGFEPGVGPATLKIPGLPEALALVCYEAVFPNELPGSRDGENRRARWMLNLTDDAWFGSTAGPYQHFAQARLRAIELGLPLVRVANSGISAFVDARGQVLQATGLGVDGVLDGGLPGALPPTWQARWGSATFAFFWVGALILSLASRRRP